MKEITVGPPDATRIQDLTELTIDGVTFRTGDAVWLTHIPTGSRLYGTLGRFYGVGRVRGVKVLTPFVGDTVFPFGHPGDEVRTLTPITYDVVERTQGETLVRGNYPSLSRAQNVIASMDPAGRRILAAVERKTS